MSSPDTGLIALLVDRPIATMMVFLATAVFGFVSYSQLPLNLMPDLSYPTLTVRTEYPGAAPEEVENQVSRPIEEALSTTDGLVSIESRSRAEVSDVVLEFDWGADMGSAAQSIREKLQTTWLGDEVERPLLLRYDPSLDPILRLALSVDPEAKDAPEGEAALFLLRDVAEKELSRLLEGMDGVAAVRVRGGLERQVLIELRQDWMLARRLSLEDVKQALLSENINIAGGTIREGDAEYLLRTLNEFADPSEIRDLQIVRSSDGAVFALSEVAEVRETWKDREVVSHLDGREAVELEVFKEADANIVTVAQEVKKRLNLTDSDKPPTLEEGGEGVGAEMAAAMGEAEGFQPPEGVVLQVLEDQAEFIEAAVDNVRGAAWQGGLLAVVVLFLFLRDLRATAIIGISIPISVVCTFAPMYLGGVSLNLMSLGGLALGVGMLVDNSVVVLESITVLRERGLARREAAIRGSQEVAAAVVASTLTTVAVFMPIVFVEGVAGQIFGDLALTVVFSLMASLAVALLLVPMMAARDWQLGQEQLNLRELSSVGPGQARAAWQEDLAWTRERPLRRLLIPYLALRWALWELMRGIARLIVLSWALTWWLGVRVMGLILPWPYRMALAAADAFNVAWDRFTARYATVLARSMERPPGVAVGVLAVLLLSGALMPLLGRELIPEVHQGRFTLELALPVGTPLSRTVEVVRRAEELVLAQPGVAHVYAAIGSDRRADSRPEDGEHSARLLVTLEGGGDMDLREQALSAKLREAMATLPHLDAKISPPALFSFKTPVELVLSGQDLDLLRSLSAESVALLSQEPGFQDVRSSLVPGYPEVRVRYNRDLLSRFGLSAASVAQALRDRVQGAEASRMSRGDVRVDLIVRLAEQDRQGLMDLERLNVNPRLDPPIPLSSVATLEQAEGPSEIRRVDQQRAAVISANLASFDLASAGRRAEQVLLGLDLPEGFSFSLSGQALEMERSLGSMGLALLLAVFLVYVIMASTFESLLHPLIILVSVPMAAVGVVPALALTGSRLSVVVFIGVIVLAGVVVNNAIVLVDCVNREREQGQELLEALRYACRARLRPIFITTTTTVLGLLPLSLGFGAGAEIQQPLAITVVAGLSASTLLTLVVVPVLYLGLERARSSVSGAASAPASGVQP